MQLEARGCEVSALGSVVLQSRQRYTNIKEELNLKLNKGNSPLGTKPHPVKIEDLTNFMS